jgi:hypothetical protein
MDELNKLFMNLNLQNSLYLSYEDVVNQFGTDEEIDAGDGKTIKRIKITDEYIILKFYMPKGTLFLSNYHNCKEEIKVIYGELRNTENSMTYKTFSKMTIPKEIPHTLLALEDSLCFAKLTKPNE